MNGPAQSGSRPLALCHYTILHEGKVVVFNTAASDDCKNERRFGVMAKSPGAVSYQLSAIQTGRRHKVH